MKQIKIVVCIILVFTVLFNISAVYGAGDFLNTILGTGGNWLGNATDESSIGTDIADFIKDDVISLITGIGNLVFFIVAAFLGVKYIWSGVSGKSEVKETLPTFIVAATFFYSAQLLFDFFTGQFDVLFASGDFDTFAGSIWATVVVIVQILAIAGIVAIGLKYMFASADKKADIKKDMLPMVIGLIMVFSISQVMNFIVSISQDLL